MGSEMTRMWKSLLLTGLLLAATPAAASLAERSHSGDKNARLTRATEAGDYGEMRRLLAQGADPNFNRTNAFRYPLLLIAATRGHAKAVEILLNYGANPEA